MTTSFPGNGHLVKRYHRHYHPRHKHGTHHLIADSVILIGIIALAFFAYSSFFGMPFSLAQKIDISFATTEKLRSGEETEIHIIVENTSRYDINHGLLSFNGKAAFAIETLPAGSSTEMTVKEVFWESVDKSVSREVTLAFQGKKTGIIEEKKVSHSFVITDSPFTAELQFPSIVTVSTKTSGVVHIRNTLPSPSGELELSFSPLPAFTLLTPKKTLSLPSLGPGISIDVPLKGFFSSDGQGTQKLDATLSMKKDGKLFTQNILTHEMNVQSSALTISLSSPSPSALPLGEKKSFSLIVKNSSPFPLTDITVGVNLESELLSEHGISSPDGFVKKRTILWTHTQHRSLNSLLPNATAKFEFTAMTDPSLLDGIRTEAEKIHLTVQPFASYRMGEEKEPIQFASRQEVIPVTASLRAYAEARYYSADGDQLGRGPLPPQVGKTTKYLVFLSVEKSIHEIRDATIMATLGENASWTGVLPVDGEQISFHPQTKKLTWRPASLPSLFGSSSPLPNEGVVFEVALTPTEKNRGVEAVLLKDISGSGKESITGSPLSFSLSPLTTRLSSDEKARGKNSVR